MSQDAVNLVKREIENSEDDKVDFEEMVEKIEQQFGVTQKTAASYIYDSAELEHNWEGDDHVVQPVGPDGPSQSVLAGFDGGVDYEFEAGQPSGDYFEELEKLTDIGHPLVPDNPTYYRRRQVGHKSDVQLITRDLEADTPGGVKNVLLQGPPGSGKNQLVKKVCAKSNRAMVRIPVGGGIRYEDLVGHYTPTESGELEWRDGILTTAVRFGFVVVLDEIDMMSGDASAPLHQITEEPGSRELVIRQTGEVVKPHPQFRVVATKNENLAGAKQMNKAFRDRFSEMQMDWLGTKSEVKVLTRKIEGLEKDDIKPAVEYFNELRGRYPNEISTPPTTRMLEDVGSYVADGFLKTSEALEKCLLPKLDEEDRDPITDELEMRNF